MALHTCCLAGPRGEGCRQTLAPDARLIQTFEAGSHFQAMTIYHALLGREQYTTEEAWGFEAYPEEWRQEQIEDVAGDDAHG